jgi:hypothetical protein
MDCGRPVAEVSNQNIPDSYRWLTAEISSIGDTLTHIPSLSAATSEGSSRPTNVS